MKAVGAHEVLVENPRHDGHFWNASETEIEQFLILAATRITDLKRDRRFRWLPCLAGMLLLGIIVSAKTFRWE